MFDSMEIFTLMNDQFEPQVHLKLFTNKRDVHVKKHGSGRELAKVMLFKERYISVMMKQMHQNNK